MAWRNATDPATTKRTREIMTRENKLSVNEEICSELVLEHVHSIRVALGEIHEDVHLLKARFASIEVR